MNKLKYIILPYISSFILAAHFLRHGQYLFVAFWIAVPFVLLIENKWTIRAVQFLMLLGSIIWIVVAYNLVQVRLMAKMPWTRLAIILGSVALLTFLSGVMIEFYFRKFVVSKQKDEL